MAITKEFWDKATDDVLSSEITEAMVKKGYIFHMHSMVGNGGWIPRPLMNELVEGVGGEGALDADFDYEKCFTIHHKPSGIKIQSNGSIDALARLWLALR